MRTEGLEPSHLSVQAPKTCVSGIPPRPMRCTLQLFSVATPQPSVTFSLAQAFVVELWKRSLVRFDWLAAEAESRSKKIAP